MSEKKIYKHCLIYFDDFLFPAIVDINNSNIEIVKELSDKISDPVVLSYLETKEQEKKEDEIKSELPT